MKFNLKWLLFASFILGLAVVIPLRFVGCVDTTMNNAYAQQWAGMMVITHLGANEFSWPAGWDDLEDDYEILRESSWGMSFEEIKNRVEIDWEIENLRVSLEDRVAIKLRDGNTTHWSNKEPNTLVLEFLEDTSWYHSLLQREETATPDRK